MDEKITWEWKPKRWWITIIVYMIIIGVILIDNNVQPIKKANIIRGIVMIFIFWTAFKDRSFGVAGRIGMIFLMGISQNIFMLGGALLYGFIFHSTPDKIIILSSVFASIPIIIWSMSRNTFFVRKKIIYP